MGVSCGEECFQRSLEPVDVPLVPFVPFIMYVG
jgi:hypothetical protein